MNPYQHYNLLSRFSRSEALGELILEQVEKGTRVLDAGCGIGLLSVWAALAGAEKVCGVDRDNLDLANELAAENGVDNTVQFFREDLWKIDLQQEGPFDVLIAMVYLNDPRRDEAQARLVYHLKDKYLKPGGVMIPSRVDYLAMPCDWPAQRYPDLQERIKSRVREMEKRYKLRMKSLTKALSVNPSKEMFPPRLSDGTLVREDAKMLGRPCTWASVDYHSEESPHPETVQLDVEHPGELTSVIWIQNLVLDDQIIFTNESVSWLEKPLPVEPGQQLALKTDLRWKRDNLLTVA